MGSITPKLFPVVRLDSIRLILSVVASLDMHTVHFDVKTAFLNGQPEGYEKGEGLACRLNKSLYGLKQASRAWNDCLISFLAEIGYKPLVSDSCVMVSQERNNLSIIAIYVDDGLACSTSRERLDSAVSALKSRFEIVVMEPECFVGIQISRDRANKTIRVSQTRIVLFALLHQTDCGEIWRGS